MKFSLTQRLTGVLIGVLVLTLTTISLATVVATSQSTERTLQRELAVSERVLYSLLHQRGQQLVQAASVLADDFGFRQAVASDDEDTIVSALSNHGRRIDSDLMVLFSPSGEVSISTHELPDIENIAAGDVGFVESEGNTYQLVVVPVRAPHLMAWVGLGFVVDQELAAQLKGLTNADVTFLSDQENTEIYASTLAVNLQHDLLAALQNEALADDWYESQGLRGQRLSLDGPVEVLLSVSYQAAQGPFRVLRQQLILVIVVTLLVSLLIGSLWGRRIVKPLKKLALAAQQIAQGRYDTSIKVSGNDELAQLGNSFQKMQEAIAEREQHISYQLYHDTVTDLPNRRLLARETENRAKAGESFQLAVLTITNFKQLNDTFGQDVCEQLLKQVKVRLLRVSDNFWLASLSEDKFVLLTTECTSETEYFQLLECLKTPFEYAQASYFLSFALGISESPEHAIELDHLLRQAHIALMRISREHHNIGFYQAGEDEYHMRQLAISGALKDAIKLNQFSLVYQPQLDLEAGQVVAVEALIRWQHHELGFIGPDEFIPLAEQSGDIQALTRWVLQEAMSQAAEWQEQGLELRIAINLSAADLLDSSLVNYIQALLADCKLSPRHLLLEVTESAVIENPEKAQRSLQQLRDAGMHLAIDDYGTGYSSLAQLRALPVTELKIDKSFVMQLDSSVDDQTIVSSTIELAHRLGLKVVAEGVENKASWRLLQEYGCDLLQGYYIARPLPEDQVLSWITSLDISSISPANKYRYKTK
ncbi:hypothetical protein CWE09_00750 [Aliidiomarina minuta]|uniref:cyclic-guanylate-specific phosphodiesterase n=1 Tax=Aliidiomarina minuta TaxID=880057 RepID=A0A432W5F7_9GAMM|nr:EAL domain-containing protein [Aliidiomarina minuta]RUO25297.1 hypothetical protein CWE09_00750 [Aliidiomarina minuta]